MKPGDMFQCAEPASRASRRWDGIAAIFIVFGIAVAAAVMVRS
jgi:hypothetical protein